MNAAAHAPARDTDTDTYVRHHQLPWFLAGPERGRLVAARRLLVAVA